MASVHHHDASRSAVSTTAFGVAKFRATETAKGPEHALIQDPVASIFLSSTSDEDVTKPFMDMLSPEKLASMEAGIAVRTYRIDEEVLKGIIQQGKRQVVVLGAGLDGRPWRLDKHIQLSTSNIPASDISWFEIDFPEVFDFKLQKLADANVASSFNYHPVRANAAVDNIITKLVEAGYNAAVPSIWVLEGFTGYLTEDELRDTMAQLAANSAKGSQLVATFIGESYGPATSMHRFRCDDPLAFLSTWQWQHGTSEVLADTCVQLGRNGAQWQGYYLVVSTLA